MKIDTSLGDLGDAADTAIRAEKSGYDGVFTGEVHSDPFLPLVLAASATDELEIGTSIAVAFARSPMTLAYTAWDLQQFSCGRFMLGLGSQVKAHVTRRFSMPWGRPVDQLREFVLAMRAAWHSWSTGEPLKFEGEFYRHTLMPPTFAAPDHGYGPPRVLLAGVGDAMTTMAGEVADGFLCHGFTTAEWIAQHTIPALVEGRSRAGRSMTDFTVKAAIYLATGTDEEIAASITQIRAQIAFYASTPSYKPVLDLHGWGDVGTELTQLSKTGRWAEMPALIDDEMVKTFAIVGAIEDVPKMLAARCDGVINRVSFLAQDPPAELLEELRS